jgi:hypothetical protein
MTDDLKHKFEQLVADPPPPSTVPSQAVFARVRTVRRRRTAGAVTLAAAAVVAVALAIGNVTDVDSRPPVSNSPSAPTVVTAAPTSPTPSGTTNSVSGAVHTSNTPPPSSQNTSNPPPSSTSTSSTPVPPPVAPPLGVHVSLKSTVHGRSVTFKVTLSGSTLVPTDETGRPLSTSGTDFVDLLGGTQYFFGDGQQSGSDAGAVNCVSGAPRITRNQTYTLMNDAGLPNAAGTHTYTKAGTYTFKYTVNYCSKSGWKPVTKTTQVTVR